MRRSPKACGVARRIATAGAEAYPWTAVSPHSLPAGSLRTRRWRCFRSAAFVAAALLGCGDDPPTAPSPSSSGRVNVFLELNNAFVYPGQELAMIVSVTPSEGQTVSAAKVILSGLLSDSLDLEVPGPGAFAYRITLRSRNGPVEGTVNVLAVASLGTAADTARGAFQVIDDGPPTIKEFFIHAGPEPGDTMKVAVIAVDGAGITTMSYRVRGAVNATGSMTFTDVDEIAKTFLVYIPPTVSLGDSLTVDVTVYDSFGKTSSRTLGARVADLKPPTITANLGPGPYDSLAWRPPTHFVGDTVELTAQARDNIGLGWVGWRMEGYGPGTGHGDSALVRDTVSSATWRVPVTSDMEGEFRPIVFFARDSSGNETVRVRDVLFVDGVRRAFQMLPFAPPAWNPPAGYVYSPERGFVLSLIIGSVVGFSAEPFRRLAGMIQLATNGASLDLAPDGLTAWAVSVLGPTLHQIQADGASLSVVRRFEVSVPYPVWDMRITSDNRAVLSGAIGSAGDPGQLAFVDLATASVTLRSVAGFPRHLTSSADGSLLVGFDGTGRAMTYDVAGDSFGSPHVVSPGVPSLTADGALILIQNRLYDRTLQLLRNVGPTDYDGLASVISADGALAYFFRWPGYHALRVSDGTLVEKVYLPDWSHGMLELSDRGRMLVIGANVYTLLDTGPGGVVSPAGHP